ncbi:MAG: hypothetical protein J7641_17635 [Cyanobacteria bacterium SID2]|nr:hypothetical protein [Cyanobacteria bacterium SID2]MBP0003706.1 hypothetical protein [Cyanobacteria bacterium SBC]
MTILASIAVPDLVGGSLGAIEGSAGFVGVRRSQWWCSRVGFVCDRLSIFATLEDG